MSRSRFPRLRTAGLVAAAALSVCVAAPHAAAATTTSCQTGLEMVNTGAIDFAASCAGFADNGAPYVFHIGALTIFNLPPTSPPTATYYNVTASCTSYQRISTILFGHGCVLI